MGLFSFKNRFINELTVTDENGNKKNLDDNNDYTVDDEQEANNDQTDANDQNQDTEDNNATENDNDEEESDYTTGAPEENDEPAQDANQAAATNDQEPEGGAQAQDATQTASTNNQEPAPEGDDQNQDANAEDNTGDTFTLPDEVNGDNTEGNEEGGEENAEDADDQGTDYTSGAEDVENADGGTDTDSGGMGSGSSDTTKDPELAGLEKDIFANVTPGQMELKHRELKQLYINLYNMISPLIDKINNIPKTQQNIPVLTFVTQKTTELKDLINYYLTNTYQTRTYLENVMNYQQYLALLNTINQILDEIPTENE